MSEEKRALTITISDLSDIRKVMEAIGNLLKEILLYYSEEDKDMKEFRIIVLSIAMYVGSICQLMGYDKEDEGEEDEQ